MTTISIDDTLSQYRLWLLRVAREVGPAVDQYDLAQEGHIAMWKALGTFDESKSVKLSTHLMNKARWRMQEVVARGTWTGKPSEAGKKYRPECEPTDFGTSDFDVESVTREQAEAVMIAYHHGEIMDALNRLKPEHRRKVIDWFWRGVVDNKNRSWWDSKGYGARDKLRAELAHLSELASV